MGNGFNLGNYIFKVCKIGPLGWVGRVAPEKGLEDAAYVANALGEKLNVWGIVQDESYALKIEKLFSPCLLYTSPSPRDKRQSRMPSSA